MAWAVDPPVPSLRRAFAGMAGVWCELAAVQSALPGCAGVTLSFLGAWLLIEWMRMWERGGRAHDPFAELRRCGRFDARSKLAEPAAFAIAGLALQPWLGLGAIRLFEAAAERAAVVAPGASPCLFEMGSVLVLAPVFEERLYRGRLLPALRRHTGAPIAITASAACFAVPHVAPLHVLGTLIAGIALGCVFALTRRSAPCIAMHVGFNAAALWQQAAMRAA